MKLLSKYFPELTDEQINKFKLLSIAVQEWNEKINIISRKDIEHLEMRHIIHSLSIAKFISFKPGTRIIDIGTGGGFPGLPLAIMFPKCSFTLVDSIAKKIKIVNELALVANLPNITAIQTRAENINEKYDFIVSRAVTAFPKFYGWTKRMCSDISKNDIPNGIIYLKGGDLSQELGGFGNRIKTFPLGTWFFDEWFNEKYIVYLQLNSKSKT